MSKKPKTTNFNYQPEYDLPKLKKVATEWDLKKHYYTSEKDPQIETDAKKAESATKQFVKKYRTADFTKNATTLKRALEDYEKLSAMPEAARVMRYFAFRQVLNVNDTVAHKKQHLFADRFRKLSNELVFFKLTLGKIPAAEQKKFLKDETLADYKYLLQTVFETAKHHLSEPEERILTLRANTSSGMWEDAVEKVISNRTVRFKKNTYTIPEALEQIDLLSWADKQVLWDRILDEMVSISEFAEHELTAIVTHEKVSDELRGFKKPYAGTVLAYENNEKAVEALVEAISTKGFALSKKFYKLKAKLHGTTAIPYVNKYDPIGTLPAPDFDHAVTVCRDTFYGVKAEYGEIFDRMLEQGQLDVYPRAGKRGGAFMAASIGLPTFVMLNHTNNFKSLETLAHEMGHAIHAERSKVQSPLYEEFSTTTAETASTLFEQLVLDRYSATLSDEEKIIFLHDKIGRDIATVQRQIAFFNFELAMHELIRSEGAASRQELAKLMQKHLQAHLGPAVDVTERDGYSYVYIPHIRYGFYVYTYAYGHLVSNLIAEKYRTNPNYLDKIDQFLSAGGSDTVENIFKRTGINTKSVETFTDSLKTQEREIKELERLTH